MTEYELAGVIVEGLGAAGVILTLLYLVKETRLHTAQIQTDSLQASIASFVGQILHVSETAENSTIFRQGLHGFFSGDAATQNSFHAMMLGFASKYNHTWCDPFLPKPSTIRSIDFHVTQ